MHFMSHVNVLDIVCLKLFRKSNMFKIYCINIKEGADPRNHESRPSRQQPLGLHKETFPPQVERKQLINIVFRVSRFLRAAAMT